MQPQSQNIAYFRFAKDDKFFLLDNHMNAYHDTDLYSDFYGRLQQPRMQLEIVAPHPSALWIFPHAQYGHFIYDEVIPSLCVHYLIYKRAPEKIALMVSASWQRNVVEDICKMVFNCIPEIYIFAMPGADSIINIDSGLYVISRLPEVLELSKQLFDERGKNQPFHPVKQSRKYFLSRLGFDRLEGSDRLTNRSGVMKYLQDTGFECVRPHDLRLSELESLLSGAAIVLSEPGTTGLLSYICSPSSSRIINMLSARCITDCLPCYAYSGWRYHMPWIYQAEYFWGKPVQVNPNPFADSCWYNLEDLTVMCQGIL